jgi:hypothetical protein
MNIARILLLVPALVAMSVSAAACGGTAPIIEGEPKLDSGTGGGDGGNADGGNADGGPTCSRISMNVDGYCSLDRAAPNKPFSLQVRASCAGATPRAERCDVEVNGNTITLRMSAQRCSNDGPEPAVCREAVVDCAVPALPAGTYTVTIAPPGQARPGPPGGGDIGPGPANGTLTVTPSGTQTKCILPPLGTPDPKMVPTDYASSCIIDSDCTGVDTNVCSPCCVNGAIATTELPKYFSDLADKKSSCVQGQQRPVCSCPPAKIFCNAAKKCEFAR